MRAFLVGCARAHPFRHHSRQLRIHRGHARLDLVVLAPRLVVALQLALGLGQFLVGLGDLPLDVAQRLAQVVRRAAILLDFQNLIENGFAVGGREGEIVGERPLRDADRGLEQCGEIRPRLHADMLSQPGNDLALLLDKLGFGDGIVHGVAAARVSRHDVFPPVQIRLEGDADLAALRAALDEIVPLVIEVIEQRPGDGFENRRLPRPVRPANGDDPRLKGEIGLGVVLDVPEFDFGNQQGRAKTSGQPAGGSSSVARGAAYCRLLTAFRTLGLGGLRGLGAVVVTEQVPALFAARVDRPDVLASPHLPDRRDFSIFLHRVVGKLFGLRRHGRCFGGGRFTHRIDSLLT